MNSRKTAKAAKLKAATLRQEASSAAVDSYSNPPARLGFGTGNLANQGMYPLTRIGQNYMQILALYRSSWITRKVVDVLAEDMLKDAPKLSCDLKPKLIGKFDKVLRDTGTIDKMMMALKWGRLFGGGVAVICIDGHDDLLEPLNVEDVDLGSYRGLIALDRWSGVFPDSKLISDMNYPKDFGLPESYTCTMNSSVVQIHHTRIIRFTGRPLPEWERQVEMYWGLSEVEVIFDELQKRDYASWNIVSLITRAQIMGVKDEQLAQKKSGAMATNAAYNKYLEGMDDLAQSLNNQGLLVLGKDGGIESTSYSFGGLADLYNTFMMDVAGAAEIPVSRLYGRSATGLGQAGEGDLQIYYDTVESKRRREVGPAMDKLLPIIAMSTFGQVPDDFDYTFPPIRTMNNKERAELAKTTSEGVLAAYQADLVTKREARSELAQAADENGLFSNITDEALAATPDTYASEAGAGELDLGKFGEDEKSATDAAIPSGNVETFMGLHGLDVNIETQAGVHRSGDGWSHPMPADYGEIVGIVGADGDWLDCYVGSNPESDRVWIVDQLKFDGATFDEHKTFLGYMSTGAALADYMAGHSHSDQVFGAITGMSMDEFKKLTRSGKLMKPVAWKKG